MSLYISPSQILLKNGSPQFSASLIKGLATTFTAYVLDSEGNVSQAPSGSMTWTFEYQQLQGNPIQVTPPIGAPAGTPMNLHARCGTLSISSRVEITIEGSDLLIYTPDNNVYHVPTATWIHYSTLRHDLVSVVQPLLANDVPVANLLSTTGGTCFLLNLNSLLPTNTEPGTSTEQSPNEQLLEPVEVTVPESDLLLYAPDGQVYQVSANTWRSQHRPDLLPVIQPLLNNDVQVANIPSPSSPGVQVGSENITCYLLNLNSLLLSNTD